MVSEKVIFAARGIELTEPIKDYILDKIEKMNNISNVINLSCEVTHNPGNRGTEKDFSVRILAKFPKTTIRVKKSGNDVYAITDALAESFQKMINQYSQNLRKWEGAEAWPKYEVFDEEVEAATSNQYTMYAPKIRKKTIDVGQPMTFEEAIQHMEFLGRDFYLFKDRDNKKVCVIYRDNTDFVVLVPTE
jgi:putative sigma-54 modulation protein